MSRVNDLTGSKLAGRPLPAMPRGLVCAVAAMQLCVLASPAAAQQRGTRTLTYDRDRGELVELPPPPPGTPEGELHAIRRLVSDGEFGDALDGCKAFVKRFGEDDAYYPAVMIARAESLIGRRDYDKAHKLLQEFLNRFAGLDLTAEALRLEVIIAETYLTGVKRKFLGLRILDSEDTAFEILDDVSIGYPNEPIAPLAIRIKADYLFRTGEYPLAELEYARLIQEYPRHRYHQPALRRSAEAALAGFRGIDYDEAALIEAGERFSDYRLRYPAAADGDNVALILRNIAAFRAEKEYAIASYYERTRHLSSAVFYYESIVRNWPDSIAAGKARSRLAVLGVGELPAPVDEPVADAAAAGEG